MKIDWSQISMTYAYKEYEVKIKMVQGQWLQEDVDLNAGAPLNVGLW